MVAPLITPQNFKIGPCEVYAGVTLPVVGSLLSLNSLGQPATGTHLGGLQKEVMVSFITKGVPLMVEQFKTRIATYIDTEDLEFDIPAGEETVANLTAFLTGATKIPSALAPQAFELGGGLGLAQTTSILLVQRNLSATNAYSYVMGYSMVNEDGYKKTAARGKWHEPTIKFKAQAVTTRASGAQIGQWCSEVIGV